MEPRAGFMLTQQLQSNELVLQGFYMSYRGQGGSVLSWWENLFWKKRSSATWPCVFFFPLKCRGGKGRERERQMRQNKERR